MDKNQKNKRDVVVLCKSDKMGPKIAFAFPCNSYYNDIYE